MSIYNKVLITGGAGMLATAFRKSFAQKNLRAEFLPRSHFDITDYPQVETVFRDNEPTLCINCAAYTKVDLAEKEHGLADAVNGDALRALAQACIEYNTRLVHFSTDYVFDGTLTRPLRPDDPVGPKSAYGRSKLLGEQLIQEVAPKNWLIVRTAWLYGPGGPNFVQTMLNAARAGKKLTVIDDQTGSPTFTNDLADATLDLIDANAQGIFHITNSGETNWFEFAKSIFEEFDLQPDLSSTSSFEWRSERPHTAIRPAYSVLDCSETERQINRKLPDWRDALHRYRLEISA